MAERSSPFPPENAKFRVKIPDVEIEYSSADAKEVSKRFDEVLEYLKGVRFDEEDSGKSARRTK